MTMDPMAELCKRILALVSRFQKSPFDFFHEKDLHAVFFELCRSTFGQATPRGEEDPVSLFRHEYDTFWRYRGNAFLERFAELHTTGCLDFAVLRRDFVEANDYLSVVNKDERRRREIRKVAREEPGNEVISPALWAGIEFKMAHRSRCMMIGKGDVNAFKKGLLADSRKLALEQVPRGFIVGFSHGPLPEPMEASQIASCCCCEYRGLNKQGKIAVLIATPKETTPGGSWAEFAASPGA